MTGDVEEAILGDVPLWDLNSQDSGDHGRPSRVRIGKDAISRIASGLEERQKAWLERLLEEKEYTQLHLDVTYQFFRLEVLAHPDGTLNSCSETC